MHATASRWLGCAADCLPLRPGRRHRAQATGSTSVVAQHPAESNHHSSSFVDGLGPSSSGSRPESGGSRAAQVQRALGVDYGRRVVGLAVSTLGLAPRPLDGVPGGLGHQHMQVAASVLEVARREACDAVVVGLPVTQAGSLRRRATDSQQGRRCRNFAADLATAAEAWRIAVFLADEGGSTVRALDVMSSSGGRRSAAKKRKDSVAAALILETFFGDPQAALLVRPWRPQGGGQTEPQRGSTQRRRQPQRQQQDGSPS